MPGRQAAQPMMRAAGDVTSYIVFASKTGTFSRLFFPVSKINKIYHICSSIVIIDSANGDPINGTIRKGMVEY